MAESFAAGPLLAQAVAGSSSALVTFALYTVAVFVIAWLSHRLLVRRRFLSEYFLGSRNLGAFAFAMSFGATSASAGTFAGFPALIYTHGWVLALWIAGYLIFPLCGMALLGRRLNQVARRAGAITLPDVLRDRFASPALGMAATLLLVFLLSFYLIPQFKTASLIIRQVLIGVPAFHDATATLGAWVHGMPLLAGLDVEYLLCLLFFAVLVVVYTSLGGFRAVVWTDVMQAVFMVGGVAIMLVLALSQVGGLGEATRQLAQMTPPRLGTLQFVADAPAPAGGYAIDADRWLELSGEPGDPPRLLRTNEKAVIAPGGYESKAVRAVEITTPEEIGRIRGQLGGAAAPLPAGIEARVVQLSDYRRGAGAAGGYVSAPGPSFTDDAGFLPIGAALSFFVLWSLGGTGQPGNLVRLMAFSRTQALRRGLCLLAVYFALIYFPLVVIFVCARVLAPGLDHDADRIMPTMAFTLSGNAGVPWLAGFLVAAPFAAAMSTVDSFMLMISSSVVRDVYQRNVNPQVSERRIKQLSYACTLIAGVVVMLGAVNPPPFMQYLIVFTGGGLAVSYLLPVALAIYWRRYNTAGAAASMFGGLAVYLSLYVIGFIRFYPNTRPLRLLSMDPLVWGLAASLALGISVTLLTPAPPAALIRRFFAPAADEPPTEGDAGEARTAG